MDRFVNQDGADFQPGTVNVDLIFTASTAGAVPSTLTLADGITSVVKSSNDYIVTFDDAYVRMLNGHGFVIQASYNASTGACEVKPTAVSIDDSSPTVTLSFFNAAGTAVALAIGDVLRFTFRLARLQNDGT